MQLPKIHFANLPRPLWVHILDRVADRAISLADLQKLRVWVDSEPHAPAGDWYKDFLRRSRKMTHFRSVKVTHLKNRISV
jgi:hypothetical protein